VILHADLDAFYASVAQRDDPALLGKPIVVSGSSRRAVVLTASYEARPFGVRSAMPLYQARERCPHLIVVPPAFDRYRESSRAVFAILRSHAKTVEGLSLDEAFLDLGEAGPDDAEQIARAIKQEVAAATGLTISIGIAAGKMVAKIACDEGKPDGLLVVREGCERDFLAPKPVGRMWGIGPKTAARLKERGIERIEQIASLEDDALESFFGRFGTHVRDLARGIDTRRVSDDRSVRSISSEETFERDVSELRSLFPTLRSQALDLSQRLQKKGLRAFTVGVKVKLGDFSLIGRQTTLAHPTDDPRIINGAAAFCLRNAGIDGRPVRLVGVKVASLVARSARQLSLFQ
jgi:DNA polymerase-4